MKKTVLIIISALGLCTTMGAQTYLTWNHMENGVEFRPNKSITDFTTAKFSPDMDALDGTEIIITGYFLLMDGQNSIFLLSKNPMASCFFCGNGGPETIIELEFLKKPTFKMDDLLSVNGILRLNRNNPNRCYYRLTNVEAISL